MLSIRQELCPPTCGVMITLGIVPEPAAPAAAARDRSRPSPPRQAGRSRAPPPGRRSPPAARGRRSPAARPASSGPSLAASIIPRVESFSGRQSTTKSAAASRSSSRSAGQSASTHAGLSTGNMSVARMRTSKAASNWASRRPTPPRPTMPTVLRVRSRVGRRMNSLLLLGAEERRQTAAPGGHQGDRVFRHLIGQHARGTGHRDVRLDHRGHQAMVHAGGRRLNPLQPARGGPRRPNRPALWRVRRRCRPQKALRRCAPGRRRRSRPPAWRRRSARCVSASTG